MSYDEGLSDQLFEAIKDQWKLKSLAEAWVSLQMPMSGFNEYHEPILSSEDVEYVGNALYSANNRIAQLEAENARLTDKLAECNGRGEIPDFKELGY